MWYFVDIRDKLKEVFMTKTAIHIEDLPTVYDAKGTEEEIERMLSMGKQVF